MDAVDSPIGKLPIKEQLDLSGLDMDDDDLARILGVDTDGWKAAVPQIREHFGQFGDRLPAELSAAVDELEAAL